ncbi:hypothetical protein NHJ6243_002619 [Beauveria neobassiana]
MKSNSLFLMWQQTPVPFATEDDAKGMEDVDEDEDENEDENHTTVATERTCHQQLSCS